MLKYLKTLFIVLVVFFYYKIHHDAKTQKTFPFLLNTIYDAAWIFWNFSLVILDNFSFWFLKSSFQEVQETQAETLLPQAETHHERALRILEEEENQRKKELEYRTARKRKEREREKEIEQRKKEKERKQREKKIESRIRINERNARTNTCSLLSLKWNDMTHAPNGQPLGLRPILVRKHL